MSRSYSNDPEPVVSQKMIGLFIVAGADVILLVVLLAAVGVTSWTAALGISGFILAVFGAWVLFRWWQLRPDTAEDEESERERSEEESPLETLKARYAAGELSDEEFESKLDRLLGSDEEFEAAVRARESEEDGRETKMLTDENR